MMNFLNFGRSKARKTGLTMREQMMKNKKEQTVPYDDQIVMATCICRWGRRGKRKDVKKLVSLHVRQNMGHKVSYYTFKQK